MLGLGLQHSMPGAINHKELLDDDDIDIPDEDFSDDDITANLKVDYVETAESGNQLLSNVRFFPFYKKVF